MLASESRVRGQAVEASGGSQSLVDLEQRLMDRGTQGEDL